MRWMDAFCWVLVMVLASCVVSRGEDKKLIAAAPPPATAPVASTEPVTWQTRVPPIELSHRPLEDVLKELKQKMPGFEYSLSRENVPHDQPVLPAMSVENVTVAQLMRLFSVALPGTSFFIVNGGNRLDLGQSNLVWNGGEPPQCEIVIGPNTSTSPQKVQVFGLEEIIDSRLANVTLEGNAIISHPPEGDAAEREKQATNDVLSLIQAALDISGEKPFPQLKIHAATRALLFKGTEEQANIVASALEALKPSDPQRSLRGAIHSVMTENKQLKEQLEKLKGATTQPSDRALPSAAK